MKNPEVFDLLIDLDPHGAAVIEQVQKVVGCRPEEVVEAIVVEALKRIRGMRRKAVLAAQVRHLRNRRRQCVARFERAMEKAYDYDVQLGIRKPKTVRFPIPCTIKISADTRWKKAA